MSKPRRIKVNLEVKLSDKELKVKARELVEVIRNRDSLEDNKKAFNSQIKANIDEATANVNKLGSIIDTEKEFREVDVRVDYDWKHGTKSFIRLDTNKSYKTETIPEHEQQQELKLKEKKKAEAKKDAGKKDKKEPGKKEPEKKEKGKKAPAAPEK